MKRSFAAIQAQVIECTRCPELRRYCRRVAAEKKRAYLESTYWARPVPAFGDPKARLLLVGLAPGAHGSNRTGRPFTGDASGGFLYPALYRAGFASQAGSVSLEDGMQLRDCVITAALRCAPPQNKPSFAQLARCAPYLSAEIEALPNLQAIVGLGSIGTRAAIAALIERGYRLTPKRPQFCHGAHFEAERNGRRIGVLASFHPSRQNTNTGKLTREMFDAIFARAAQLLR